MAIPQEILDEIQDRIDIAEVIGQSVPLKRAGRNLKGLCPFHSEKTPSFMVNPEKRIFHCFGCGVGGDVFSFLMKYERLTFPEAVETLASKAGVRVPARSVSPEAESLSHRLFQVNELAAQYYHEELVHPERGAAARRYLEKRGIRPETWKGLRLGWAPARSEGLLSRGHRQGFTAADFEKAGILLAGRGGDFVDRFHNRIIFPIVDARGRVVAFGGRVVDDALPKYLNSPETPVYQKSRQLYGLLWARDAIVASGCAVVVEGYLDFAVPFQAGVKNLVASLGTALTSDQARLLRRYARRVVILYDGDAAGEAASLRGLDLLLEEGLEVRIVALEKGEDPDSFVCKRGGEALVEKIARAQTLFDYKLSLLSRRWDSKILEERVQIAHGMLETLGKIPDAVLRAEYVKRLGEVLSMDESTLADAMPAAAAGGGEEPVASDANRPALTAEWTLLALMLDDAELVRAGRAGLDPDEWDEPQAREIFIAITRAAEHGKPVKAAALVRSLEREELVQRITELAAAQETIVDRKKSFEDCLKRVKQERLKKQLRTLELEIKAAETGGRAGELNSHLKEHNRLLTEWKRWR